MSNVSEAYYEPTSNYYAGFKDSFYSAGRGIKYAASSIRDGVAYRVHVLAEFTKTWENYETLLKVSYAAFNALALIPVLHELYEIAERLQTLKSTVASLKGIRSIDNWLNSKETGERTPLHLIAYTVLCTALTVLTTLNYLNKYLSYVGTVYEYCRKVPILGVLDFAGVFDALLIGTYTLELYQAGLAYWDLRQKGVKINRKIEFWQKACSDDCISTKLSTYKSKVDQLKTLPDSTEQLEKYQEKLEKLTTAQKTPTTLQAYKDQKVAKWKMHQYTVGWEKTITLVYCTRKVIKIVASVTIVGLLVSGAGVAAVPFIRVGVCVVDCVPCTFKYFVRRKIRQVESSHQLMINQVAMEQIKVVATAA